VQAALLDDPAQVEAADPGSMLRQVASSAAQIRSSLLATQETDLGGVLAEGRPRAVVVAGMGGSGLAGDVLAAVCGPGCPVQIATVRGHQLPGWVGAADLVFAVSSSGTTEETLAAAEEAARRGCRLIGVGGARSALANLAEQARAPFVPVRSAGAARSTLWGLSVPLIEAAARLGLCDAGPQIYEAVAGVLEEISQRCRPDSEAFLNPGKGIALDLAGTLPVIWGTSPLTGVAAHRFASQLNANAKYPAVHGVLPEANYNQVVTFDGPFAPGPVVPWTPGDEDVLFSDPDGADGTGGVGGVGGAGGVGDRGDGPAVPLRLVVLTDTQEHPQVTKRREASVSMAADRGIEVTELTAEGDHPLERLASLVQLIDYATVYLGIALGFDPSPIATVQELKARIA
jgi:glucose/mannose-6-phosphate isomerase